MDRPATAEEEGKLEHLLSQGTEEDGLVVLCSMLACGDPFTGVCAREASSRGHLISRTFLALLLWNGSPWCAKNRDESLFLLRSTAEKEFLCTPKACESYDIDGSRARRCLVHTLLRGDLRRNCGAPIHKSFFRSVMFEGHLLKYISCFLIPKKPSWDVDEETTEDWFHARDLCRYGPSLSCHDWSELLFLPFQSFTGKEVHVFTRNSWLFPVVACLSLADTTNITSLTFSCVDTPCGDGYDMNGNMDLAHVACIKTPALKELKFVFCRIVDLSPLSGMNLGSLLSLDLSLNGSECNLASFEGVTMPALRELRLSNFQMNLSGFSCVNTASLKELYLKCTADFRPLTDAALESLEVLSIEFSNTGYKCLEFLREMTILKLLSLHIIGSGHIDLTPLLEMENTSLETLELNGWSLDDLSCLRNLRCPSLYHIQLTNMPFANISFLQGMQVQALRQLDLEGTKVSDLSPLLQLDVSQLDFLNVRHTRVGICGGCNLCPIDTSDLPSTCWVQR